MMLKFLLMQSSKSFKKLFKICHLVIRMQIRVDKSLLIVEIALGTNYLKLDRLFL